MISIGSKSDFSKDNTTEYYTSENLKTWHNGAYNNIEKIEDMNAEQDVVRMSYYSPGETYEEFGYAKTGKRYFITSRSIEEDENGVQYMIKLVHERGAAIMSTRLNRVNPSNVGYSEANFYVRPVVRVLKTDVSN